MALISPTKVEREYGIPVARLRRWRQHGIGPEYFQLTPRSIGYYTGDLADWIQDPANAQLHDIPGHEPADRCGRNVLAGS
ncbi:helix-turn-helix transcriptional regulator [Pseudarthrobacter sp. H2]|uniref:helix-turn-helix transcriptional regulator n=1 Tax=Pseudarthrobacter sp. H2 TaxID=3418415 RepID=UPI003CF27A6D